MTSIPVIDLAGASTGVTVPEQLRSALSGIGIAQVVGHGIAPEVTAAAFEASQRLFALPEEEKRRHLFRRAAINCGYNPRGAFKTADDVDSDSSEAWAIVADFADARPQLVPANSWPDDPAIREPVVAFHRAVMGVAERLLAQIALSLELDEGYFGPFHTNPLSVIRLLHYPPRSADATERTVGVGPHTDWGAITLLVQDDVGTLEVETDPDTWIEIPPHDDALVLNTGDLFQMWTNDRYHAARHRVLGHPDRERYSIAVFYEMDVDADVAVLPTCVSDEEPAKYQPTTPGAHIEGLFAAHRVDDTTADADGELG